MGIVVISIATQCTCRQMVIKGKAVGGKTNKVKLFVSSSFHNVTYYFLLLNTFCHFKMAETRIPFSD